MDKWAVAHIFASHNNIIITATDSTGAETIAKCSGGMVVRSQREESRPHAAMLAAGQVAEALQERGIKEVHVKLRGCLLYTSPSPRDRTRSRMPSSA